ncbi:hypothetical protein CTheo_6593 [Ceratobasidium theobromae]|uniref:Uncharacterized protein n=1 Tax=Ceratobasidium theobromae TaxID=1582974 RepID=A0A5N5QDZ1_9AGAM|nr:hypothetical protein CTheo_6593 [Ceratobasidium theobromae]
MATLGSLPTNALGLAPILSRPLGKGIVPKHLSHPEALPLVLSLSMGVGSYMGLRFMAKSNAPAATEQQTRTHPAWRGKGYRLGLTEESVGEVLFSIDM